MKIYALTTKDNPYDPFNDFDHWYEYDETKGYCTSEYLARLSRVSNDLPSSDYWQAIGDAIDVAMVDDVEEIYKKLEKNV